MTGMVCTLLVLVAFISTRGVPKVVSATPDGVIAVFLWSRGRVVGRWGHAFEMSLTSVFLSYERKITVQFPYAFDAAQLEGELALMMADLQADETEKLRYESMSIDKFWLGMDERHELISHYVTKHLVKFGTTYACEAAFSTMLAIKSKYRTRITNEHLEHNLVIILLTSLYQ